MTQSDPPSSKWIFESANRESAIFVIEPKEIFDFSFQSIKYKFSETTKEQTCALTLKSATVRMHLLSGDQVTLRKPTLPSVSLHFHCGQCIEYTWTTTFVIFAHKMYSLFDDHSMWLDVA